MNFIKVQPHKTYHQYNDGGITCKYPIVKIINKNWKLGLRACWQTIVLLLRKQSMLCRFLSNWAETWNIQRLQGTTDVRQKHMFHSLDKILLGLYKCKIKFVFQAKVTKLEALSCIDFSETHAMTALYMFRKARRRFSRFDAYYYDLVFDYLQLLWQNLACIEKFL